MLQHNLKFWQELEALQSPPQPFFLGCHATFPPKRDIPKKTAAEETRSPSVGKTIGREDRSSFLGQFRLKEKGAMRLTLYDASTRETRPDHDIGNFGKTQSNPELLL